MIINFDSGKQRNYWFLIFIGQLTLGWIIKIVVEYYYDEKYFDEIGRYYSLVTVVWVVLGKYILRLIKIK